MVVRQGNLTGFTHDQVLDQDDLKSLEGQTITTVVNKAALPTTTPLVGFAWVADTEELMGWDGTKWVTISKGFEQPILKPEEADDGDRTTLHSATQTHLDNDYWHDSSIGQQISARNSALTGAQSWHHNPFGLVDSSDVEVFRTKAGGCAVWLQQDQVVSRHKITLNALADADVQFLLVGAGGAGAGGRNLFWESIHPLYKACMLSGGGGAGGEVRTINLRVFKGQILELTGMARRDGGGIQLRSNGGILLSVLPGGSSVTSQPMSRIFTNTNGIIPMPVVPESSAPNAGASQWSQVIREVDIIPATSLGVTTAARYWTERQVVPGGVTTASSDHRYYPHAHFGFGGGKSLQPGWGRAQGFGSSRYAAPMAAGPSKSYDLVLHYKNSGGASGGGGSMVSIGENARNWSYDNKASNVSQGGRSLVLDDAYWPTKYKELAPGGQGMSERSIDLTGGQFVSSSVFTLATQSTLPGAGGNGGVGEGGIKGVASYPAGGGQAGLAMVRWSYSGRPLPAFKIDYT